MIQILNENCDRELAKDRSLPYTAYLVTYEVDTVVLYDIVVTDKPVDIFDHYWDKYRTGFKSWRQSEGRINPRMWNQNVKQSKKKR